MLHQRNNSQASARSHISFASAVDHPPGEKSAPERQQSNGLVESPMTESFPSTNGGLVPPQRAERSASGVSHSVGSGSDEEHSYANVHWGHSPSVPRSNDHRCLILCFDGTGASSI